MKYQEALRASLTPLGRVFKIGGMFLYSFATNNVRAESPKAPSPGQAKRHPGLQIAIALTPCKVGCSKSAIFFCTFFTQ